ncbi:hypothetical protein AnigIFM63604_004100 [Aspergillus niger]|uniref:HPP transmembrane region domain-containing protein n=1 Tax=Aspergillus niger TaxID=5061 RepID=A0A9W6AG62_ASPNG|nr:hypothetical protein AnigIFM63604_003952 [Aspergillus niger]GLA56042.1 hypothetical protein AnigIFM63604_004100 [Aspergillus niger]
MEKNHRFRLPSGERGLLKHLDRFKFQEDYRSRLPDSISRFTGYRPPGASPPYAPLPFPLFSWLTKIPLKYEIWFFAWVGAFGGILLIEAIMSTSTAFRDVYNAPTIITSFGASAVLLFGVIESPVAQPRNFVFGHFLSALVGTCITRLFVLNRRRRYPLHWWAAGVTFVRSPDDENHQAMRQDEEAQAAEEEREEHEEGDLAVESDVDNASVEPTLTHRPRSPSS